MGWVAERERVTFQLVEMEDGWWAYEAQEVRLEIKEVTVAGSGQTRREAIVAAAAAWADEKEQEEVDSGAV